MFISDDGVDVTSSVFNERPFSGSENSPAALRQSTLTVVGRIATHCCHPSTPEVDRRYRSGAVLRTHPDKLAAGQTVQQSIDGLNKVAVTVEDIDNQFPLKETGCHAARAFIK